MLKLNTIKLTWVACADIVSGEVALRFRLVRFKVAFPPISIGVFDNDYDVIHFEGELIGVYRLIIVHRIHKLLCWFLNSLSLVNKINKSWCNDCCDVMCGNEPDLSFQRHPSVWRNQLETTRFVFYQEPESFILKNN